MSSLNTYFNLFYNGHTIGNDILMKQKSLYHVNVTYNDEELRYDCQ